MTADPVQTRLASFGRHHELDPVITELSRGVPRHEFLANPSGQYPYHYLCDFVKRFSETHFGKPLSELRVVDWGCGRGQVSYLLRKLGAEVVSCDVAPELREERHRAGDFPILEKTGLELTLLDHAWRLPFESESVDVFLSFGVLEHVPHEFESLTEIRRSLKPGGLFFCLNLPNRGSWVHVLNHLRGNFNHERFYTPNGTRRLLESAGLQVLDLWFRQLFPKNSIRYPNFRAFERLDQLLCRTPLGWLATSLEFLALRPD